MIKLPRLLYHSSTGKHPKVDGSMTNIEGSKYQCWLKLFGLIMVASTISVLIYVRVCVCVCVYCNHICGAMSQLGDVITS